MEEASQPNHGEFATQLLTKNGHPRRQAQTSVFFKIRVIKLVLLTLLKLMPLKVIVVGAGIGGICAATSLRQAGHDVEVFEKSGFTGEVGAALSLTPNGSRVLSSLGFSFERARACKILQWDTLLGSSMERVAKIDLSTAEKKFGASCWAVHRVDLHNELLRLATSEDTANTKPITLRLGAQVVDASTDGSITLKDGSRHTADLIVAADGLHSVLRNKVLTQDTKAPSASGLSAFRFLMDTKKLEADAELGQILEVRSPGYAIIIDAEEKVLERHMVWYPCRDGEVQNFVGVHPTRPADSEDGEPEAMRNSMLEEFGHYDPRIVRVISESSHVKCWPLYVHDPLPSLCNGRIVLIGDAGHPMLPFGGQGSNCAMEDAGALGHLFRSVHDPAAIEPRLALFEQIRKNRASRIQIESKVRLGKEEEIVHELKKYADPPGSAVASTAQERTTHDYEYDVFAKCAEVLQEA